MQEQTGLFAGKGGFDINVGGHTQLNGAVIASDADPSKNSLVTNSLGYSDIQNRAKYDAISASVSFSSGGDGMGGDPTKFALTPGLGVPVSEQADSTTKSAIAQGSITVKQDQATGQDSTAGLSRDTASANGKLDRIFDAEKVAEQQEFGRVLGEVGFRAAGDLAQKMGWQDGSPEKIALHALMGALQAKAGGGSMLAGMAAAGANEWIGTQVADYLQTHTDLAPEQRKAIQQWAAVASGAVVGGLTSSGTTGALSGGAVALDGEKYNRQLHQREADKAKKYAKQFAAHVKEVDGVTISEEEAEGRLARQMLRWADYQTAKTDNFRADEAATRFLGKNSVEVTNAEYYNPNINLDVKAAQCGCLYAGRKGA
ncbi:DUF637 domain-containing protein [Crenobacter cavernae]|uniref:DUF637 domain-containing protein n=1 Tax=Crenobacter cavernae TaxID=2290923 RepID=UPI00100EE87C|nr:DUF637 domain-containing protein [Crenobacter cavernae]